MLALLVTSLLATSPLDVAREHLAQGRLDELLFALDGKVVARLSAEEARSAAGLLGDGAAQAFAKGDDMLALQLAERALRASPQHAGVLETAARSALKQQQFEAAEAYADRWTQVSPKDAAARLLRAQLASEAGDWNIVIDQLDQARFTGAQAAMAKALRARANGELREREASLTTIAALERRMAKASIAAARERARERRTAGSFASVVLYSTAWCPYCRKARELLTRRRVEFVERDVEKDPAAAEELARKAQEAGVQARGVPVIDIRGKLVLGFDEGAIEDAL